jgi:hypothetical protein
MPIPIGTFAMSGKVEFNYLGSGTATVTTNMFTQGSAVINDKTLSDSVSVTLNGDGDGVLGQVALLGTAATNQEATVLLQCRLTGAGTGEDVVISGGRITVYRLQDPDHLKIHDDQVD